MLDKRSIRIVETFFLNKTQSKPDFIFPGMIVDPVWRKENNIETPLLSDLEGKWDTPGAYAFFEPCNQNNEIEVMYVGRSKTLRGRLGHHWRSGSGSTEPVMKWSKYCWDNDYPFCPYVAIYVSYGDLREIENLLKNCLSPRFNVH